MRGVPEFVALLEGHPGLLYKEYVNSKRKRKPDKKSNSECRQVSYTITTTYLILPPLQLSMANNNKQSQEDCNSQKAAKELENKKLEERNFLIVRLYIEHYN